ncbi:MAG: preprotein translocase subunit SecE [Planctomycetaceae bacterium]|jgi:preprotein translocase subunit SecE|nr:preprotein translocase subunit SecE [Planctomycetaceae bacterium]
MGLIKELFRLRRYKTSQGRLIRRMTMAGVWIVFATGAWKCTQLDWTWFVNLVAWMFRLIPQDTGMSPITLEGSASAVTMMTAIVPYAFAGLVLLAGLWFGYRVVNWSTFADFLISVEAEMVKVSWPGMAELRSSTIVVLVVFILLSAMIYVFDLVWVFLFKLSGVV